MIAAFRIAGRRRPAVQPSGSVEECPACGHAVLDHPVATPGLDACAACTWEADLGMIAADRRCQRSYVPVAAMCAGAASGPVPAVGESFPSVPRPLRGTGDLSDDQIVEEVVSRLTLGHRDIDAAELAGQVRHSLATTYLGAKVRRFLPVLIERQLTARLGIAVA